MSHSPATDFMSIVSEYFDARVAVVMFAVGLAAAPSGIAAPPRVNKPAADGSKLGVNALPVYDLEMEAVEWEKLRRAPRSEERHPAKFRADGKEYTVGVRYRGDWARSWPKKPLKIFFEDDKDFEDQHVLNLNPNWRDPAFIREQLAYHIYTVCDVPAPQTRMIKLNLNGQFHGVFLQVEQPAKPFLKRVGLKGAVVYKGNSRRWKSDVSDLGPEEAFHADYEKQTHKDEGYQDLQSFCHELAVTTDVVEFFNTNVELDRYTNFLAGCILVQNWDWFTKNNVLVHDIEGSKKWVVLPWDLDRTLGDHPGGAFNAANMPLWLGTQAQPGNIGWNKLYDAFYKEPVFRKRLLDRLEILLQNEFTQEKLFPILDRWELEIGGDVALDRKRWPNPGTEDIHAGIAEVKQYIKSRRDYLFRELKTERSGRPVRQ